ncbi:MAG: calcium/sodium antiporter [Acutalibacteraceae bacterium]|nr:calcium/sodium antiporter [Acutalibacteraceae bacterium]
METVLMYLLFAVGVVLIVKGGDWFVDGAAWVAEVTGIPKFIVGATIVSVATTLPEIIVSAMAAIEGHEVLLSGVANAQALAQEKVGMAIGNGVGSVICNTAMIMAFSLIFMPTEIDRRKFSPKAVFLGVAVVALFALTFNGSLSSKASIVLIAVFLAYIAENIKSAKADLEDDFDEEKPEKDKKIIIKNIFYIVAGAACIVFGSRLLVNYGSQIAKSWGVSEAIIGVTMVAIGTSLPELVTAVTAVIKKQPSMSVGNAIGANVIDIALILPICSFIYGGVLPVSAQNIYLDFPVAILVSVVALVPTIMAKKFRRWQGIVMLAIYIAYLVIVSTKLDWYLAFFNIAA